MVSQERIDEDKFERDFVLRVSENLTAGLDEDIGFSETAFTADSASGFLSWARRIVGRYARVPASI